MHQYIKLFLLTACLACGGLVACDDSGYSVDSGEFVSGEISSVAESSSSSEKNLSSSEEDLSSSSETEISSSEQVSSSSAALSSSSIVTIRTTVTEDSLELFYFGSVKLDFPADSFMTMFEYGDMITVMIPGYDTVDVPVVNSFGYVTVGEYLLLVGESLSLEVSYGEAAEAFGIVPGVEFPIEVIIQMKEKYGYRGYMAMHSYLSMAYEIEAYPDLTVEQFANFRMVKTTGMGDGKLYRSSSPVNPSLGRNTYSDSLAKVAGVATFVNLADAESYAQTYKNFANSYYASQNVVYLELQPSFVNTQYKVGLAKGLRYMIEHEGPYLLHCTYGMDRTGFTIAILEALMGAKPDEIREDYVTSYKNFFSVFDNVQEALPQQQVELIKELVITNLKHSFKIQGVDISDIENVNLADATEKYLLSIGMEKSEIEALRNRLK